MKQPELLNKFVKEVKDYIVEMPDGEILVIHDGVWPIQAHSETHFDRLWRRKCIGCEGIPKRRLELEERCVINVVTVKNANLTIEEVKAAKRPRKRLRHELF